MHAGLLADGIDVGTGDSVWPCHVVFQVNLVQGASSHEHTRVFQYLVFKIIFTLTSSERFILAVMVEKMRRFCLLSGSGNSIFRSNLFKMHN